MQLITTRSGLRTQARGLVEEGEVGGALGAQLGQARLQLPQLRGQSGSRMLWRLVSLGGRGPLGEKLAHGREPTLGNPCSTSRGQAHFRIPPGSVPGGPPRCERRRGRSGRRSELRIGRAQGRGRVAQPRGNGSPSPGAAGSRGGS